LQSGLPISLADDVPTATVTTALCPRRVEVTSPGLRLNDQVAQHLALPLYRDMEGSGTRNIRTTRDITSVYVGVDCR